MTASVLTRRRWCMGVIAALGALSGGGCATVSPERERQIGGDEAKDVERTVAPETAPRQESGVT